MKYFFAKSLGELYGNITTGRNLDKVKNDPNKLVIIYDEPIFHVITYREPLIEEEKKIFDYAELLDYIKENRLNLYFFNSNKYVPSAVVSDINRNQKKIIFELPTLVEEFYTKDDIDIIRMSAFVDREVVRNAIKEFFDREMSKAKFMERMNKTSSGFEKVPFKEFITNQTLLDMYNLPLFVSNDDFVVPTYSYIHSNMFYILNGIYSKLGDKINLNEQNIRELYQLLNSEYNYLVQEIMNNIEVKVERRYDIDAFAKDIDYLKEHDSTIDLNTAKSILLEAENNKELIQNLGLLNKENAKQLEKKPVTK